MQLNIPLEAYLGSETGGTSQNPDLCKTIITLGDSAIALARKITQNSLIEPQNSIELVAADLFAKRLAGGPIGLLISENFETPRVQNLESDLAVVIYPLEGVSNAESALLFGSIFSIYQLASIDTDLDLSGATLLAAGFFLYGPQTLLVLSCGQGTSIFTLNPDAGEFTLIRENLSIPLQSHEFAIDTANYRFWDSSVRNFVDDCVSGSDGPLGVDFKLRWNRSLVVEAYCALTRGGVYLFPDDARPGFETGRHKLLYEAIPIAFLIEQAGGKAADGYEPITDKTINQLDTRVPLIFGAQDAVDQVFEYYKNDPNETTRSPLFENRSLFRN